MWGLSDERKVHRWEGVEGHPDFKRVFHKDPLIFFIDFYCFHQYDPLKAFKYCHIFKISYP